MPELDDRPAGPAAEGAGAGAGDRAAAPAGPAVPPSVPNPAAPDQRAGQVDGVPLSRPARRMVRIADRLPDWLGSVRFRLTATYSLVLFGLAAFMVAGLYTLLAVRLHDERVWREYEVTKVEPVPGGFQLTPTRVQAEYRSVEQLANERSLALLRTYSASALFLLFLASLGVGWLVAGRVLAPIGRITSVARDIQATDLSRRIDLRGPPDELKELADTFDAMLTRLDDAFAGQQRFIQEASHELRNPLAVIRTNLDVALSDPDPDPVELRHTAELVSRTASRMSRLVDDLMVYGRRGAPAHELAPVEMGPVAAEVAEEFRAPAGERHIRVAAHTEPGLWVQGDRIALRQALANLLTNAVRLAPAGSTIRVSAERASDPDGGGGGASGTGVDVSVADEGPGIAPEHRELVFQRFWRGDGSSARDDGRSGLGLAIVDQIVRDHDGSVSLGEHGAGSVFTLHLPAVPVPPPTSA